MPSVTKVTGFRMRFPKRLATALLVSCIAAPAAQANLILNGSFESPIVPSSSLSCGVAFNTQCQGYYSHDQINPPASALFDIAGWSVIGLGGADGVAVVMQLGNGYTEGALHFDAQDGTQSLDLTGEGNQGANGVKQSFSSTPGGQYVVSFYLGHQDSSQEGYAGASSLGLYIDGSLVTAFSNSDVTSQDVDWNQFAYSFTAASNLTTLAFLNATGVGNNFTGLDDVVLLQVPEPGTLALLGAGLAGLFFLRRRKTASA